MKCKLCNSQNVEVAYCGHIRTGKVGNILKEEVDIYRCKDCGIVYHEAAKDLKNYYESAIYREIYEGTTEINNYYRLHDGENINKFNITGTGIFRNKIVADIGCGGGGFLDFLSGVAKEIVAVEPSEAYRCEMAKKGYHVFAYSADALPVYRDKIDVITSFDVLEHVGNPVKFLKDIFMLLAKDGQAIIGTPTEMPVLRAFAGEVFDKSYLFNTEHPWIFNRQSLEYAAKLAGFGNIRIEYRQRYGFGNFINWLKTGTGKGNIVYRNLPPLLNVLFNATLEEHELADYIVAYLTK